MPVSETNKLQDPKSLSRDNDSDDNNSISEFNFTCLIHENFTPLQRKPEVYPYSEQILNDRNNDSTSNKGIEFDYFRPRFDSYNKLPTMSNSYLKPNTTFIGEQQSGKAKYHIKVEFKTVDWVNSILTGFLQISGLTEHHPEITTFFKGEIINNPFNKYKWETGSKKLQRDTTIKRYSFITENDQWGSFIKNDLEHWKQLTDSKGLNDLELKQKLHRIQNDYNYNDECIYMRWKEEFLLPDSRIKQINGASFEGFYYIVLNLTHNSKLPGSISGLYYHKESEKFQSLSLRCVEDHGISNKFDFV